MFGLMPLRKDGHRERTWPEYPLARARNEFETLFERFLAPWTPYVEPERFWKAELVEMDKELVMRAEVPGFEPEDFHIEVRGNELVVKAERKREEKKEAKEEKKSEYEYEERSYERTFALPVEIEVEKVTARYHNGILEVHLPRTEAAVPRRISVGA